MSNLNDEQIVLLNNLIYINIKAKEDDYVKDIVRNLLNCPDLECILEENSNCVCFTTYDEWMCIFKNIIEDEIFDEFTIRNIVRDDGGVKMAAFVNRDNEAWVVFRGTNNIQEWDDNARGAYEYDTEEQIDALKYVNSLEYESICVTGHSKGGNKAQYTAILSDKVRECVSLDGQGFSNEFIEKYSYEINKNKYKIRSINAKNDYINCLFNCICGQNIYIKTKMQTNPLFYHKANVLLNEEGRLNPICQRGKVSKIINDYSLALISELPKDIRNISINGVIGAAEIILCKNNVNERFIKIAGGIMIILVYSEYYFLKKQFFSIYEGVKALTIPLIFWNELMQAEELNSFNLLKKSIEGIKKVENDLLDKFNLSYITKESLEFKISSAVKKATDNLIEQLNSKVISDSF